MPATTTLFGVAALGACGLPLGAGFVSEWLLVQSLIHAAPGHNTVVALTTPLAVGAVALTTGLGVAAMVKAFGIGFLARPRCRRPPRRARHRAACSPAWRSRRPAAWCWRWRRSVVAPALRRALAALPAARKWSSPISAQWCGCPACTGRSRPA